MQSDVSGLCDDQGIKGEMQRVLTCDNFEAVEHLLQYLTSVRYLS